MMLGKCIFLSANAESSFSNISPHWRLNNQNLSNKAFHMKKDRKIIISKKDKFDFARKIAVAPLSIDEFALAAKSMPIAFRKNNSLWQPVVVMGTCSESNAYVDFDGKWKGSFLPKFLQAHQLSLNLNADTLKLLENHKSGKIVTADADHIHEKTSWTDLLEEILSLLKEINRAEEMLQKPLEWLNTHGKLIQWIPETVCEHRNCFSHSELFIVKNCSLATLQESDWFALSQIVDVKWAISIINAHLNSLHYFEKLQEIKISRPIKEK